ncbi:hypothetical protein KAW43_02775 [Candidatus Parcubacteria bacterium]|nr:hypothetical protein [Candidatus Parcubacteria bacterium]
MKTNQKIILIFILVGFMALVCAGDFALAQRDLEVIDYPDVPGAVTPGKDTELPQYVKYLFNFAIGLGGILAFVILIFGGIKWMTSAGDPTKINEAKTKMLGGIIGLILLLGAWFIIDAINPKLLSLKKMDKLEPNTGIYVTGDFTDNEGNVYQEKRWYVGDIQSFTNFVPTSMEFISEPLELLSVFEHTQEEFKGSIEEIENTGKGSGANISGKSISFQWAKSGFYLYEEPDFDVLQKKPEYLSGSAAVLKEWDNMTESIKIKHPSKQIIKMGVAFTEPNFNGKCELVLEGLYEFFDDKISNDLITRLPDFPTSHPGAGKDLSSMHIFTLDTDKEQKGEVIFYDEINCQGNSFTTTLERERGATGVVTGNIIGSGSFVSHNFGANTADERVMSFKINGPYVVVIMTKGLGVDKSNRICQRFLKPNDTNCYGTLKGSNVFDPDPNSDLKPRGFFIVGSN